MTESLNGTVTISVQATLASGLDIGTGTHVVSEFFSSIFTSGTGASQVNQMFTDTRSINASSNESLDLSGGLTNAFGTSLLFTGVKALFIKAAAANTNTITVGGAASNGFVSWVSDPTDAIVIPAGAMVALVNPSATGFAVAAGTADLLKITNNSGTDAASYQIIILGEV